MNERQQTANDDFSRDFTTLRRKLKESGYLQSLAALDVAPDYHLGHRKDGVTPNFHHQVKIAFMAYDDRQLISAAGLDPDEMIAGCILHDTYEENQGIRLRHFAERPLKSPTLYLMLGLSKVQGRVTLSTETYYENIERDPRLLIIKLYDRRHNLESVYGLGPDKFAEHIAETALLLSVAKKVLGKHPELEGLIQHSRNQLKQYLALITISAQMFVDGILGPYAAALERAGMLTGPSRPRLVAPVDTAPKLQEGALGPKRG